MYKKKSQRKKSRNLYLLGLTSHQLYNRSLMNRKLTNQKLMSRSLIRRRLINHRLTNHRLSSQKLARRASLALNRGNQRSRRKRKEEVNDQILKAVRKMKISNVDEVDQEVKTRTRLKREMLKMIMQHPDNIRMSLMERIRSYMLPICHQTQMRKHSRIYLVSSEH